MRWLVPWILLATCGCAAELAGRDEVSRIERFDARGPGWSLLIKADSIRLREKTEMSNFYDYFGVLPTKRLVVGGVRYEGSLKREYAVAGLAEEDIRPYVLTITTQRCTDRKGRVYPTSVSIEYESDYRTTGCGSPLPR